VTRPGIQREIRALGAGVNSRVASLLLRERGNAMWWLEAFVIGWVFGMVCVILYIRGRLMERWYITGRHVEQGYEVIIKKGKESSVIFRVQYDRPSSPNPDTGFSDQLMQARNEAEQRAEALNTHERLARDANRRGGTPGGIT